MTQTNDHVMRRIQAGLPPQWRAPGRLMFDRPTDTLVFSCTPSAEPSQPSLFVRHRRSKKYISVIDLFSKTHATTTAVGQLLVASWVLGHDSHLFFLLARLS